MLDFIFLKMGWGWDMGATTHPTLFPKTTRGPGISPGPRQNLAWPFHPSSGNASRFTRTTDIQSALSHFWARHLHNLLLQ